MTQHCKISLKRLSGKALETGYNDRALRGLFGTSRVQTTLDFTHERFSQEGARATRGMSISGVQEKLSLALVDAKLETVARGGEYILKPSPTGFANAAENEHAAMLCSQAAGIPTAQCGLVSFSDGELAYITKRFDRTEQVDRLPQEDIASIAGLRSEDKYELSYEEMGMKIKEAAGSKLVVSRDFLYRVMLSYLIGNEDLHAKNLSLTRREGNQSEAYDTLTPNYDVLFTSSFEGQDSGHFLAVSLLEGEETPQFQYYGYYTGHDFLALGEKLGLTQRVVKALVAALAKATPSMERIIQASYMPDSMKAHAAKVVTDRMRALRTGIDR